ncbi:MAG: hypothetical protein G01um101430_498 [Parcubacteria group bacterium Gr01-1014_30]|nr:MAG: hypothetical protein G01um101430_498 [Parcubacteria group bacterium Gr01-1014_30]
MQNRGFIALITILMVSAVALLIGSGLSFLSIGEAKMSLQKNKSSQAHYLVTACVEEALMRLKNNINYPGNEIISLAEGSCQVLPIVGNWTLRVSADYANQVKKVRVIINQVNPSMEISSWQEVADF